MATQAQYDAATKAVEALALKLIHDQVPRMFQAQAHAAAEKYIPQAAKAAVDAAEGVKEDAST